MEVIPCNEGWTWLQMCYFRLFKQGPCSCIKHHGWLRGDTIAANLQSRPKLESHEDPTKFIGNWCDSLHVTAFHLRFSPQVLGYHLECSEISHFPLPAAKLFWSSPVPFWAPDMSCLGTSHDNFGAPQKWIGVTCPKHCYLRGFRHLTPFHSKTWIALVASCGDPWSQFLWVALFRIRDLGRPWEPQNISLNKNPDSCDGNDRFSRDFTAKTKAHRGWEWLRVI